MENQLLSENKFLKRRLSFLSLVLNNIVDDDTRYKINQMLSTMEELSDNDNSIHCLRLKYVYSSDLTKRDGLDKTNIG